MTAPTAPQSSENANEIHLTRVFHAPAHAVWDAWTDPAQAARWWGPRGFTITTHTKDLRPGGQWVYTMHGPDGTDFPNIATYHVVEKHRRLIYDHGATPTTPPLFRVTVTFAESAGTTTMHMTMAFDSPEAVARTREIIRKAGGNSTWDRLAEYLEKQATGHEQFVITRTFAAPLDTLWNMWTNPDHFTRWLPPTGFTMDFRHVTVAPGHEGFYRMTNGADVTMYGRVRYLELTKPHRLVYTQQFCDEHGGPSHHPMLPVWPASMHTTVELTAEGPDHTRVKVTWQPEAPVTPEQLAAFVNLRAGMTQGWTGSFDKLDACLATQ